MEHFVDLEEENLSLITQLQENESQREVKKKIYEEFKTNKRFEISGLMSSVEENKHRSEKIALEKNSLELQTSKGSANLGDKAIYKRIVEMITETRNLYEKSRAKQQVDPTIQLVEIEGHINRVLKFLKMARISDPEIVFKHKRTLQLEAKKRRQEELLLNQQLEAAELARKLKGRN